jgi:hypothetical protein
LVVLRCDTGGGRECLFVYGEWLFVYGEWLFVFGEWRPGLVECPASYILMFRIKSD